MLAACVQLKGMQFRSLRSPAVLEIADSGLGLVEPDVTIRQSVGPPWPL